MTPARRAINSAIKEFSKKVVGKVLFVGVDKVWDYKHLFNEYETLDINPNLKPDIVGDITNCPQIENGTYAGVIMTGVYEYLDNPFSAFRNIERILKVNGKALICIAGEAYYENRPVLRFSDNIEMVLRPLVIERIEVIYYRDTRPYYFIIEAKKWQS